MYGLVSRALHVRQLLLHFVVSGGAFGAGRGSQRRLRSQARCPPPVHSVLVQTVPLCAECPPTLVALARTHKGAVEKISVEVSSMNESSMKTI